MRLFNGHRELEALLLQLVAQYIYTPEARDLPYWRRKKMVEENGDQILKSECPSMFFT